MGVAAEFDVPGDVGAHVEERADVDELGSALLFDFIAEVRFFRLDRTSLLSPKMSFGVQPENWRLRGPRDRAGAVPGRTDFEISIFFTRSG